MPNATIPSDPLFPTQWGLLNTGQQGGHAGIDIDVMPVLGTARGQVSGKGVRVAVIDDGTEMSHPDLVANIDAASSYDAVLDTTGNGSGNPNSTQQNHGTATAGIIGAAANGIGTVGVAPDATLVIVRVPLGNSDPLYASDALIDLIPDKGTAILNGLAHTLDANVDVANNSWGTSSAFGDDPTQPSPFLDVVQAMATMGRGGKGINTVKSNGNERMAKANGVLDGLNSSRFVIAVGALDNNGVTSSYSTPGANLLVTAPAGGSTNQRASVPGNGIATTDRTGTDGYNKVPSPGGDDTFDFNGTSAAAPFVSGVVALMLQANPNLGYRDVQQILAMSARQTDPAAEGWTTNAAHGVNGGGLHFNTDYGFGLVDAHAAVRLSQSWALMGHTAMTQANVASVSSAAQPFAPIPIGTGARFTFSLGSGAVEHVDLVLSMTVQDISRVSLHLISPSGTDIALFRGNEVPDLAWPGTFQLGTDAFWGEQAAGTWTVQVRTISGEFNSGSITEGRLTSWGGAAPVADQIIFTDDFGMMAADDPSRTTIHGAGATTFNAAATKGPVALDLRNRFGSIGGTAFSLAQDASFSRVFGGDGANLIVGDAADHTFITGYGTTTLLAGGGDTQVISQGQDTIFAGSGGSAIFGSAAMLVVGGAGTMIAVGQGGSDTIFGGAGGGAFFAGTGGGSVLVGGSGLGSSTLVGGGNGDTLFASGSARTQLVAGAGNETLFGGLAFGDNTFFAGSGNAVIVGGSGNDTIFVGHGNATVDGGAGRDLIVVAKGMAGGSLVINNLRPADGSRITLQGYAEGELANGLANAAVGAGGTTITLSDNTRLTLVGMQPGVSPFV